MCGLPYCMLRLEGDDSRSSAIICEVLVPENSLFGGKNFCDFHFFFSSPIKCALELRVR